MSLVVQAFQPRLATGVGLNERGGFMSLVVQAFQLLFRFAGFR